jgi:hypothetical protein
MRKLTMLGMAVLSVMLASVASAEEAHMAPVRDYVTAKVRPWLSDPAIVKAIQAQNMAHADLNLSEISALDQKWRAEVESDLHPMIDAVLANPLSAFLRARQEASEGAITEIFVMDAKGMNVGQSEVTSDYWQGDEEKFARSFGAGPRALFIGKAEKDDSTQMLQSQASMTIVDEAGKPIGAITVGINLDEL